MPPRTVTPPVKLPTPTKTERQAPFAPGGVLAKYLPDDILVNLSAEVTRTKYFFGP